MVKEYRSMKVDKHLVELVKKKFPTKSFNKAITVLLISSGLYEPDDTDQYNFDHQFDQLKYYVSTRLGPVMEKIKEIEERTTTTP